LFTKPLEMEAIGGWVQVVEGSIPSERVLHDWIQMDVSPD